MPDNQDYIYIMTGNSNQQNISILPVRVLEMNSTSVKKQSQILDLNF